MQEPATRQTGEGHICDHEPEEAGQTYYVRFFSGDTQTIEHAQRLHLTGEKIVLVRKDQPPAVFLRKDVYFVGCEECEPPIPC